MDEAAVQVDVRSFLEQSFDEVSMSEFGGLMIWLPDNPAKCEIHAVKWADTHPLSAKTLSMVQREVSGLDDKGQRIAPGIHIATKNGPHNIPYIPPDTPVKYLGA